MLDNLKLVRSEMKHGKHHFDFLLEDRMKNPFYLEVKSATFVENKVAQFPDAVTAWEPAMPMLCNN